MTITTKLLFALILALAALTPAVAADISAREADVTIIGQIESGDDKVFSEAITPQTKVVYLISPGGYLDPSLRIARTVRDKGYETVVGHYAACSSGCAIVWFAGKTRRILSGGRIGLHSASEGKERNRSASGNATMIAYLRSLGTVPEAVLSLIEQTEPTTMHYINIVEATQLGLVNAPPVTATARVSMWDCPVGYTWFLTSGTCTPPHAPEE
jgi:hypothetical protein